MCSLLHLWSPLRCCLYQVDLLYASIPSWHIECSLFLSRSFHQRTTTKDIVNKAHKEWRACEASPSTKQRAQQRLDNDNVGIKFPMCATKELFFEASSTSKPPREKYKFSISALLSPIIHTFFATFLFLFSTRLCRCPLLSSCLQHLASWFWISSFSLLLIISSCPH